MEFYRYFRFTMVYESTGGSLKLKGISDKKIKKKKKSKSDLKEMLAATVGKPDDNANTRNATNDIRASKTKAERAFEKILEKRMEENILKKAEKSHKEHVGDYNKHLESLSEFHDIPKVSWTK